MQDNEIITKLFSMLDEERARVDLLLKYIGVKEAEVRNNPEGTSHNKQIPISDKRRWPAVRDELEKRYAKAAQIASEELSEKSEIKEDIENAS